MLSGGGCCAIRCLATRRGRGLAAAASASATAPAPAPAAALARAKREEAASPASAATGSLRAVKVTSAIRAYLKSAERYDQFMKMERDNFELGKRFLAGMMGVSVSDLTQENIEKSIRYLFPSGLTLYGAKPHMSTPEDVFPKKKALQCDFSGRPNHSKFYMKLPNFYQLMSDIAWKVENLKQLEDKQMRLGVALPAQSNLDLANSTWLDQKQLEKLLIEQLSEAQFKQIIAALDFLAAMPLSHTESEFIMTYRNVFVSSATVMSLPELQLDAATQRHFSEAYGQRKWATAHCRLYAGGTGKFTVNGETLLEAFPCLADREALASPLVVAEMLGKVDVEATLTIASSDKPEGHVYPRVRIDDLKHMSSQSGALRLAIARAIACHLPTQQLRDRLRMSGLLTPDMRLPERKYYGQSGPRDRWTWKAR